MKMTKRVFKSLIRAARVVMIAGILVLLVLGVASAKADEAFAPQMMLEEIAAATQVSVAKVNLLAPGNFLRLDATQAATIRKIMSDPKSYDGGSRCIFSPGYLVRFATPQGNLDVLLCFFCGDYRATSGKKLVAAHGIRPSAQRLWDFLSNLPVAEAKPPVVKPNYAAVMAWRTFWAMAAMV